EAVASAAVAAAGFTDAACASTRFAMKRSRSSLAVATSSSARGSRLSSDGNRATRGLRASLVRFGWTLHTRSSSIAVLCSPRSLFPAVRELPAREHGPPWLTKKFRQKIGTRVHRDPPLDFGVRDRGRHLPPVSLIDFLGRRLDVRFGDLLFLGEEFLELL